MEINYNKLGKRIRTLRKAKALSQEKLAENAGISNNYLSNIENNYSIPSLETLLKICSALDTTPNELLLGIDTSKEDYLLKRILVKK